MNALYWLGLAIALALSAYLLVALARPEKF